MTNVDDNLDAPCDNGFAVDLRFLIEADKHLKEMTAASHKAAEMRRAAILRMKTVHNLDHKRIGNLLGRKPGTIYRAITPRRGRDAAKESE